MMNDKVLCPWCGSEMERGPYIEPLCYVCPKCKAESPPIQRGLKGLEEDWDTARIIAQNRWQESNRPLTLDEFKFAPPTVVWIELREADRDMLAAVFTSECVYEVQNGMPWEDYDYGYQGLDYGIGYRVWSGLFRGKPTDAERAAAPWEDG